LHEVGKLWSRTLEGALPEKIVHERSDIEANLRPKRLVVRLENHPLSASIETLLDVERGSTHRDVFVLVRHAVGATQGARAPHDRPVERHRTQTIYSKRI